MNPLLTLNFWKSVYTREYWRNVLFKSTNQVDAFTGRQTNDPLDAFGTIDFDTTSTTTQYFGGVTPDGDWVVQKWVASSGTIDAGVTHITYATLKNGTNAVVNNNNYATESLAWTNRATLTFSEKSIVFAGTYPN